MFLLKKLAKHGISTETELKNYYCKILKIKDYKDNNQSGDFDDEIKKFLNVLTDENKINQDKNIKNDHLSLKEDMFKTVKFSQKSF